VVAAQALVQERVVVAVDAREAIKYCHADLALIALLATAGAVNTSFGETSLACGHLKIRGVFQMIARPGSDRRGANDDDEDNHAKAEGAGEAGAG